MYGSGGKTGTKLGIHLGEEMQKGKRCEETSIIQNIGVKKGNLNKDTPRGYFSLFVSQCNWITFLSECRGATSSAQDLKGYHHSSFRGTTCRTDQNIFISKAIFPGSEILNLIDWSDTIAIGWWLFSSPKTLTLPEKNKMEQYFLKKKR